MYQGLLVKIIGLFEKRLLINCIREQSELNKTPQCVDKTTKGNISKPSLNFVSYQTVPFRLSFVDDSDSSFALENARVSKQTRRRQCILY